MSVTVGCVLSLPGESQNLSIAPGTTHTCVLSPLLSVELRRGRPRVVAKATHLQSGRAVDASLERSGDALVPQAGGLRPQLPDEGKLLRLTCDLLVLWPVLKARLREESVKSTNSRKTQEWGF